MPNRGPTDIRISWGGTDISPYVLSDPVLAIEALMEDQTEGYSEGWTESLPVGKRQATRDITLEYFHDEDAGRPFAVLGEPVSSAGAATTTLAITYGGTNQTYSVEAYHMSRTPVPSRTALTRWRSVIRTTGAVTVS